MSEWNHIHSQIIFEEFKLIEISFQLFNHNFKMKAFVCFLAVIAAAHANMRYGGYSAPAPYAPPSYSLPAYSPPAYSAPEPHPVYSPTVYPALTLTTYMIHTQHSTTPKPVYPPRAPAYSPPVPAPYYSPPSYSAPAPSYAAPSPSYSAPAYYK